MTKLKIFVAGHKGMVGSAIARLLKKKKFQVITKTRDELNLINQKDVKDFFKTNKIDHVYLAAAKVGGIYANNRYPANFIYENLVIQTNVINSAFYGGVKKLLFLGSSCIYPKKARQPIEEEELLNGKLETTNEPYAVAKIAGIKMCESYNRQFGKNYGIDYRCIMPTNLYGPGDNYHPENSHVIPGLIYRFHQAKIKNLKNVSIWGTGKPRREFLYVDDMARASIHIMNLSKKVYYKNISSGYNYFNVGTNKDITIKELAEIIKKVVGFNGKINFNVSKPDGTFKKLLNSNRIFNTGFKAKVNLNDGLIKTYQDFLKLNANI